MINRIAKQSYSQLKQFKEECRERDNIMNLFKGRNKKESKALWTSLYSDFLVYQEKNK